MTVRSMGPAEGGPPSGLRVNTQVPGQGTSFTRAEEIEPPSTASITLTTSRLSCAQEQDSEHPGRWNSAAATSRSSVSSRILLELTTAGEPHHESVARTPAGTSTGPAW